MKQINEKRELVWRERAQTLRVKDGLGVAYLDEESTLAEHRLNIESAIAAKGHEGSNPSTSSIYLSFTGSRDGIL